MFLAEHTVEKYDNMALVSQLENLFQKHLNEKQNKVTTQDRRYALWKLGKILVTVSVVLGGILVVLIKHKNRKKMEEKDRQIEKAKNAHQKEKKKLQQALTQQRTATELRRESFLSEPICRSIHNRLQGVHITAREGSRETVPFSEEDAANLRKAVLNHYEGFESYFSSKCPTISQDDLILCRMYLLGLDERQIAVLQSKTYSAVKKRADKLKAQLGAGDDLRSFVLDIATRCEIREATAEKTGI